MPGSAVLDAHDRLTAAVAALDRATGPGAEDADLLAALTLAEGTTRALDRTTVAAVGALLRRGTFGERGYRNPVTALTDLLGRDRADARRLVLAAEHVEPRTGLDGTVLPPRLPATAMVFGGGQVGVRHIDVIARVLATPAAGRLAPPVWAAAEEALAGQAVTCTPAELLSWGTALIDALDADGAEPDDTDPPVVNEVVLRRHPDHPGGTLTGRFDDAAMFSAIATVLDTGSRPSDAGDDRTPAQRRAAALADACAFVLDHGDLPTTTGQRPHLTVTIRLTDLEQRTRGAVLDLGGALSPTGLRQLACDARVIPVVLDGAGQPLDIGRAQRTVPEHLRRAVVARDGGCARCGRPPSWCEVHHVQEWQHGGPTDLDNLVLLCRACHRLIHHAGWAVTLHRGRATFTPPAWIDPDQRPRPGPPRMVDLDQLLTTAGARAP